MVDKFIEDITKHGLGDVIIYHINDVEGALAFAKIVKKCIEKKLT